jgi:hypothetical protein
MSQAPTSSASLTFFTLLSQLSQGLIKSLRHEPEALEKLLANPLLKKAKTNPTEQKLSQNERALLELIQELIQDLSILDDYLEMQMKDEEEYSEEKEETISDFIEEALPLINAYTEINEGEKNADFEAGYATTHQRILKKIMPIDRAEEALFEWDGKISDAYLRNALIRIRFAYIDQKVS